MMAQFRETVTRGKQSLCENGWRLIDFPRQSIQRPRSQPHPVLSELHQNDQGWQSQGSVLIVEKLDRFGRDEVDWF